MTSKKKKMVFWGDFSNWRGYNFHPPARGMNPQTIWVFRKFVISLFHLWWR